MKTHSGFLPKTLFLSALTVAWTAGAAHGAACPATTIDLATYGGTYTLSADLVRDGSNLDCLTVTGTGTVNLNGHSITATAGQDAITCLTSQITITDTASSRGSITGTWSGAAVKNCRNVNAMRILGFGADNGIYNITSYLAADLVTDNVIEAWSHGIYLGTVASRQSRVSGNAVAALTGIGIEIDYVNNQTGSGAALIEGNTVSGGEYRGIWALNTFVDVVNNYLRDWYSSGPSSLDPSYPILTAAGTASGNYCDCNGQSNCDDSECTYSSGQADPWEFPSFAANTACPGTVSGTVVLSSDYDLNSASGSCLTISQAYTTIDLNGHVLTNSSNGGTAITCTGTGTTVSITDSTSSGGIRGRVNGSGFATGISGCRTISELRIKDVDTGVTNSSTANGLDSLTSTVIDAATVAVDTYAATRTSSITGNKLRSDHQGIYLRGVGAVGTGKVDIADNVIRESHDVAIKVTGSTNVNVHNNLMYRRDASLSPSGTCLDIGSVTKSSLLCDCADDCPNVVDPPIIYPF